MDFNWRNGFEPEISCARYNSLTAIETFHIVHSSSSLFRQLSVHKSSWGEYTVIIIKPRSVGAQTRSKGVILPVKSNNRNF